MDRETEIYRETKGHRDRETERLGNRETKGQRDRDIQRNKGT
jgi:hypothetical protein